MKIPSHILLMGATSAFVWGGVSVAPSYAIKLIGNLPSNDGSNLPVSRNHTLSVSFTLPSGGSYRLDNVVLRLGPTSSFVSGGSNITGGVPLLTIRNNKAGFAGPTPIILANFTNPPSVGINADYTFIPTSSFAFQPSTTYWLSLTASAGTFGWSASSPRKTPSGIATFGKYGYDYFQSTDLYTSFQINATATATPTAVAVPWETDALSVVGSTMLFGLGLWGRNKLAQKKIDNLEK